MSALLKTDVPMLVFIASNITTAKPQLTTTEESDALFIACTQLPTRQIIEDLKCRLKRPVWSAARATAWDALRKLNLDAKRLA